MFKYFIIFIVGAIAITYTSYKISGGVSPSSNFYDIVVGSDKLDREFNNSYRSTIKKTGNIIEYNLEASPTKISFLDDKETEVWAYNNQVPGPTLKVSLGDTLRVNFENNLPQETTIHWHGVRVPNAMDGVPGVTQDSIKPGETFTYEFVPKDAGTFWFHPHNRSSEQIERGLYGVLIVEDPEDPNYSQDLVWVVDDWRIDNTGQIDDRFNTSHDLMHDGRWGNVFTVNSLIQPSYPVSSGERIRLRLINVSNARVYKPSFTNITAKAIAVDGMTVKDNFVLGNFELSPGNRIDLDITIPKDNSLSEISLLDSFTRNTNKLASLEVFPEIVDTPDFDIPNYDNIPDWNDASSLSPDITLNLNAKRVGGQIKWTINDRVYPDVETITLQSEKFNKILLNNESARIHPMHLHGQFFKVLSRNGVSVNENFWRDTVLVKSREKVEIGLVPLDKGKWLNHCHALEHAEAGMMTIIEVI